MYRIEGGQASVRSHDVVAMCQLYRADPALTGQLVDLARQARTRGWWRAYGDAVPAWFELYVGLEDGASRLRQYQPSLIPGLLQTREYATAVHHSMPGRTPTEVAGKVALRMERQKVLTRRQPRPPRLEVIVDEVTLHRPAVHPAAWRDQLTRLADASRSPSVSVRVVPSSAGPHLAAATGGFVIMDFPAVGVAEPEPTTVYSEHLGGALYLDKPAEVAAYAAAWHSLVALALDESESDDLIMAAIKETVDA
jgi:hypothetical protein